jgi:WD40 repeat protein
VIDLLAELVAGDRRALLARLPARPGPELAPVVATVRRAIGRGQDLPAKRWRRLLALTASHLGLPELAGRLGAADACRPAWAHGLGELHQELVGHAESVRGVAFGRLAGRDVLVSVGVRGEARIWDEYGRPVDAAREAVEFADQYGRVLFDPFRTAGRFGEREVTVVGKPATVAVWDKVLHRKVSVRGTRIEIRDRAGRRVIGPLPALAPTVRTTALGRWGGRDVVAAASGGSVWMWDEAGPAGKLEAGTYGRVIALAMGRWSDGDVLLTLRDRTVWRWDPGPREAAGPAATALVRDLVHGGDNRVLAVGRWGDLDVVAVGDGYHTGTVRVWDRAGRPVGRPLTGAADRIEAIAIGRLGGRDVIATADGTTVRLWDRYDEPVGVPLAGPRETPVALAAVRWQGRDVVAGADRYAKVDLWEPDGTTAARPFDFSVVHSLGPSGPNSVEYSDEVPDVQVCSVALGRLGGTDVLVTGGYDLATGGDDDMVDVLDLHGRRVVASSTVDGRQAVAVGRLGDRDVLATAWQGPVRLWDERGYPLRDLVVGSVAEVEHLRVGHGVIVAAAMQAVSVWDAHGERIGVTVTPHAGPVTALAIGLIEDGATIVSGGRDGTVRVWRAGGDPAAGTLFIGHAGPVAALAVGSLGGRDVVVSAGQDRTVRIWDRITGDCDVLDLLDEPAAVLLHRDRLYVGSGPALSMWLAAGR